MKTKQTPVLEAPIASSVVTNRTAALKWMAISAMLTVVMSNLLYAAPSVGTEHLAYLAGEPVRVWFANTPGGATDWVGIYRPEHEPGPVGSTKWLYAGTGRTSGSLNFTAFNEGQLGDWVVYFFIDDGYVKIATNSFRVVDVTEPYLRTDRRSYYLGGDIAVAWTNSYGTEKDWIGIYSATNPPGVGEAIRKLYVDGTAAGNNTAGITLGSVIFAAGLNQPGAYLACLQYMDTTNVIAMDPFDVVAVPAHPQVLQVSPGNGSVNRFPDVPYSALITNGFARVKADTVALRLDGNVVSHTLATTNELFWVTYTNTAIFASQSQHTFELQFADDGSPAQNTTNTTTFTVATYKDVVLPAPLYFQDFDGTPEGQLPPGWTQVSYTDQSASSPGLDLGNLDSASYATWTVVDSSRFEGSFMTYSDPNSPPDWGTDYQRVLSINPLVVRDHQVLHQPLASGRFLFGNSGYRNGLSQVLYCFSPDYSLTGKSNIWVAFYSLYEQNQDSIAAVEYSVDQGATWLPIVYLLDGSDIIADTNGVVDAEATLTNRVVGGFQGIAIYTDPVTVEERGGYYGAFVGVASNLWPTLAPHISARVDNDPIESKRIECYRVPQADNRATVRFRFAYAGSDSWYFGVDNLGLYSIATLPFQTSISLSNGQVVINWTGGSGPFQVERASRLSPPDWQPVGSSVAGPPVADAAGTVPAFYRVVGR